MNWTGVHWQNCGRVALVNSCEIVDSRWSLAMTPYCVVLAQDFNRRQHLNVYDVDIDTQSYVPSPASPIASIENLPGPKTRMITAQMKYGNGSAFTNLSGSLKKLVTASRSGMR